jgi:hypothetical protein
VEANLGASPRDRTLSLSLSRPPATLVTPTTSTSVQDNTSLIPSIVFHLASTHLGRGTQQQIHWSVDGPRGSETPTALEWILRLGVDRSLELCLWSVVYCSCIE